MQISRQVFYTYIGNTYKNNNYKFLRECDMKVGNEWKEAIAYCDDSNVFIREKEDFFSKFKPIAIEQMDVQDFIYYGDLVLEHFKAPEEELGDYNYARYVLSTFNVPASLSVDIVDYVHKNKLFAVYEGKKYRVVGLSRLGDVWLTDDFDSTQYTERVCVTDLSHFSKD